MNKFLPFIIAGGMLAIFSCSDKNTNSESTGSSVTTPAPTVTQTPEAVQAAPAEINQATQTPTAMPVPGQQGTSQITTTPVASNQTGLNPAHGQPGHRCDIPVGASLSLPPGGSTPSPTIAPSGNVQLPNAQQGSTTQKVQFQEGAPGSSPSTMTSTPVPASGSTPTVTAPGMNPPHGEPGHDCTVAVGAPLKK